MPWSTLRDAKKNAGTGFHYYRARYYHPTLQRFVAEDSLEFLPEEFNLYGYAMNNPVLYRDPYGLALDDWTGFPTRDEHFDRNKHNRRPWTPPSTGSKTSDDGRKWSRDSWGRRIIVPPTVRNASYDSKGNLRPIEGTYNYGSGRDPWTRAHFWKDVVPHYWYWRGKYTPYYDPAGSAYGP